ncbi:hypothetical protein Sango_1150700 [Sesamum angolense]|uniref:Uncharacterized protein n=1 Tax=Sesamum angolense TaxID=2727404 RepID=A0AAE2BWJ5_9LAMI|nr:hypothetical protein Sango_1150700 [Sesamum angolense]
MCTGGIVLGYKKSRHFPSPTVAKAPSSSHLLIPTGHEFLANGFCLLYPLPNHNTILIPTRPTEFPSPLLPISHLALNKPSEAPPMPANSLVSSLCHSSNTEPQHLTIATTTTATTMKTTKIQPPKSSI